VIATVGVVVLSILQIDVPPALAMVVGSAVTWLFVRSAVQAEHAQVDAMRDALINERNK